MSDKVMAESDKAKSNGKRSLKTTSPHLLLQPGSLAVRTSPKQNLRRRYDDLRAENEILRAKNECLEEKLKLYEKERNRCNEISREHAAHLVSGSWENIQVGNNNSMHVVHKFDAKTLEQLLKRYDEKLEKAESHREKLSDRIKELEKLQPQCEAKMVHDYQNEVQQLTENEKACPVSLDTAICKERFDTASKIQESVVSLQKVIDELKRDPFSHVCSSTVPLHDRNHSADSIKCHRRNHSEIYIDMHV